MRKIGIFLVLTVILMVFSNLQNLQASKPVEVEYLRTSNSKVYDPGNWNQFSETGDYMANFYDSPTVYFAVKAKGVDW